MSYSGMVTVKNIPKYKKPVNSRKKLHNLSKSYKSDGNLSIMSQNITP